jgi:hypothetical protein
MALIVEDGTIVAGANSFASAATARAYALARGITLSATDSVVEAQLLNAMDYFTLFTGRWRGYPVSETQTLVFPRTGISYIGPGGSTLYYPDDEVPEAIVSAQIQLAMAIHSGVLALLPTQDAGLPIIKEKVGPLETTYATPFQMGSYDWNSVSLPIVDLLLRPFLNTAFGARTVRI